MRVKKWIVALLAVCLVLSCLPAYCVYAEETVHVLDVSADMETISAGTYEAGTEIVVDEFFTVILSNKTKVDSSSKTFDDGYAGTQRLNFQGKTKVYDDGTILPAVKFTTFAAATIKLWWVEAGDDNRQMAILNEFGEEVTRTNETLEKNNLCISELTLEAAGTYYLGTPDGSNYLFKMEVIEETTDEETPVTPEPELPMNMLALGDNQFNKEDVNFVYTAAENGVLTLRLRGPAFSTAHEFLTASYSINDGEPVTLERNVETALNLCAGDVVKVCVETNCSGKVTATWVSAECNHDYVCEVVAPSCLDAGYTLYTCTLCGDSYIANIVPATGMHVMPESALVTEQYACSSFSASAVVMPASNVTVTFTALLNSSSSWINIQQYDAENGIYNTIAQLHDGDMAEVQLLAGVQYRVYSFAYGVLEYTYVGSPVTTIAGNCYTETVSRWTCAACGAVVEELLGYVHNLMLDVSIAPTESTYGYSMYACQDCGAYGIEMIEPLHGGVSEPCEAHNWADVNTFQANGCETYGYQVYACLDCGGYDFSVIWPSGHTGRPENAELLYPRQGWDGYYWWCCQACGMYMEETVSWIGLACYGSYADAAAFHDLTGAEAHVFQMGSCAVVGSDVYLCNCCRQFIVVEDPNTGFHVMPEGLLDRFDPNNQVVIPKVEPIVFSGYLTADEAYDGHYYTFVVPCDGTLSITKNGNFYVSGIYDGSRYAAGQTLTVNIWGYSGDFDYEVIIIVTPDAVQQEFCGKDATCTEAGYTAQWYCERCNVLFVSAMIEATGHRWNNLPDRELSKAATCEEDGYKVYTCMNHCGEYRMEGIAAYGHSYEAVVTEPTFEAGGYTTYTCTVCGHRYVGDYTDPLPYIPGDLNDDGTVDTDDGIYLLYYTLFGDDIYAVNQPCDFDGSGDVDTDDAIYLLYHTLFGEESYPLMPEQPEESTGEIDATLQVNQEIKLLLKDGEPATASFTAEYGGSYVLTCMGNVAVNVYVRSASGEDRPLFSTKDDGYAIFIGGNVFQLERGESLTFVVKTSTSTNTNAYVMVRPM